MIRETTTEGPSVAEALDVALEEMGVQQDAVEYEVLAEPARGFFGGQGKPARVRVWLKAGAIEELTVSDDDDEDEDVGLVPAEIRVDDRETPREFTDAELDAIADAGVATINDVLRCLGMSAAVEEYEGDEGEIILDIVGEDLGLLIGRHGRTLDAMQVLVSAITNRKLDTRYPLVVDVSGYRHRRRSKVEEIARRAAERAVRQHRPIELRPMTSFERRIVHMALRGDARVTTESEGLEPRRQVVVHPK